MLAGSTNEYVRRHTAHPEQCVRGLKSIEHSIGKSKRVSNTCTLTYHNAAHNADGAVSSNGAVLPQLALVRK